MTMLIKFKYFVINFIIQNIEFTFKEPDIPTFGIFHIFKFYFVSFHILYFTVEFETEC